MCAHVCVHVCACARAGVLCLLCAVFVCVCAVCMCLCASGGQVHVCMSAVCECVCSVCVSFCPVCVCVSQGVSPLYVLCVSCMRVACASLSLRLHTMYPTWHTSLFFFPPCVCACAESAPYACVSVFMFTWHTYTRFVSCSENVICLLSSWGNKCPSVCQR